MDPEEGAGSDGEGETFQFHSFVAEAAELARLVKGLENKDFKEEDSKRLCDIIEKYQEQPQLLDPHLEGVVVVPVMTLVRKNFDDKAYLQRLFRFLYVVCKVRGYKTVVKLFPHEVVDLEPTLALLEAQDKLDHENWETRYMLLLWMSVILLVPFDLSTIDSNIQGSGADTESTIVSRIIELCKMYLADPAKTRDGAAVVLSKLFARGDVARTQLARFLEWCRDTVSSESTDIFTSTGVLSALCAVFKVSHRKDLLPHLDIIGKCILSSYKPSSTNILHRKLAVKLTQRLGLVFLKPRVAAWRYQRGQRSLLHNLGGEDPVPAAAPGGSGMEMVEQEDEEIEVPEEIEEVIEHLLSALRDRDTIVRWSAAKGIGRITNRLPNEFADEVVGAMLDMFNDQEGDTGWHGSCLTLAELARRGLLLPSRLPTVMPLVLRALQYDVRRGAHSVGSNVRDAACYVCWAFARAYTADVMEQYVREMASGLLITAIFDREVNCRRAASAAFQENVGRQGNFPHGIDILTAADYFTLGNRTTAYLDVSVQVACYDEYRHAMIDHVVQVKAKHWDQSLRELAARTVGILTATDPAYIKEKVIPYLLPLTLSAELSERHGAILAIAEAIMALHECGSPVEGELCKSVLEIVPGVEKARLYRGRGGEIVRGSVCRLLECIASARLPAQPKQIAKLQDSITENLKHPTVGIQNAAVAAFKSFCNNFYTEATPEVESKVVGKHTDLLRNDPNAALKRGFSLALGSLPRHLLTTQLEDVVDALIEASQIEEDPDDRDAETRRNAIVGLSNLVASDVGMDNGLLMRVYGAYLEGLGDYSKDNRGDVGSWVREACMLALEKFVSFLAKSQPDVLTAAMTREIFSKIAQQAVEKIDRMRDCAGSVFFHMLHSTNNLSHVPHKEELLTIFPASATINWAAPGDTFPLFVRLLAYDEYRYDLIVGLGVSVGGLTESLERHAGSSMVSFLKDADAALIKKVVTDCVRVFNDNVKNDRLTIPLMKMLDLLLSRGSLEILGEDIGVGLSIMDACRGEIRGTKDPVKLIASIGVFCGVCATFGGAARTSAMQALLILLGNRFPKVRKIAADQMYTTLLTFEDGVVPEDIFDDVLGVLLDSTWDGPFDLVKGSREKLFEWLDIEKPAASEKKASTRAAPEIITGSYGDLVKEMGY